MSRLGRYLSVLFVTLMLVVSACSKSVEGETKKWDANVGELKSMMAEYPGFKPALEARLASAEKIHAEAEGLADDAKIKKLSEANAALNKGFVSDLQRLEKDIKTLREKRVEAAAMAGDESSRLGAKVAAEDAQKALDRADAALKAGAADEASANAVVKKVSDDIATSMKAVDAVVAADKSKKDAKDQKAAEEQKAEEQKAADAKAEKAQWKCEYCGTMNAHDHTKCESCGAPKG